MQSTVFSSLCEQLIAVRERMCVGGILVPRMSYLGLTQAQIDEILIHNPRRVLTFV